MRKVVTVITAIVSVLAIAPATVAQTPTATVSVTQFDCVSVTVTGSGWEQTEATVEVGVLPPESEQIRENLIAGPIQVFPDEQGNIAPTVVQFNRPPPDGDHTAVVLVDGLVRGQSPIFELTGCRTAPPGTVSVTQFDCVSVTVTGSGWEQTEATVEVGVLPPESEQIRENLIAGPIQVFPDEQGNIAPTVVPFNRPPPDGDHTAVVLVDGLVRGQSPIFELTRCRTAPSSAPPTTSAPGPTLPATGSSTTPLLAIGLVLLALGLALARSARTSRHRLD